MTNVSSTFTSRRMHAEIARRAFASARMGKSCDVILTRTALEGLSFPVRVDDDKGHIRWWQTAGTKDVGFDHLKLECT